MVLNKKTAEAQRAQRKRKRGSPSILNNVHL
jgi:hypothetical protein